MGRKRKKQILKKGVLWGLVAVATVPGILSTAVLVEQIKPQIQNLREDAAVFSALSTVPDRAIDHLEQRFAGDISDPNQEELPFSSQDSSENPPKPSTDSKTDSDSLKAQDTQNNSVSDLPELSSSQEMPEDYSIPQEYQGEIVEEDFSIQDKTGQLTFGAGVIKNTTSVSDEEAQTYLQQENPVQIDSEGPQVLIMHTHATESFEPYDTDTYDTRHTWRTTDNTQNIVAAGEVMAQAIRAHGIEVLHDETQHDYPSYNGSYERSAVTVQDYLDKYPSIKVVLDVHRDAVQRDTTLVKPITEINGKKAAQMMIIAGCDDGTMDMPNWSKNFRFAAGMQDTIESRYPTLTRPVFFCYRKYNQDLTTGSLLLELGSHGNTLEEVLYTAQLAGDAIGSYLDSLKIDE